MQLGQPQPDLLSRSCVLYP